jgi:hypothetical protein
MKISILLALLFSWQFAVGQARPRSARRVTAVRKPAVRQDFVIVQNTIWTLDKKGNLLAFGSDGVALPQRIHLASSGVSLHATSGDSILAHAGGKVMVIDTKTLSSQVVASLPDSVPLLARDKHQRLWAAGNKGLVLVATGQAYVPDSTQNGYYKWLPQPAASLLDTSGRLWVGFGMGEWGGNLHIFNTETQRFEYADFRKSEACLAPVKSFCQVADQVYMSCGVMHFLTFGCITRFDAGQPKPVLISSYEKNYRTVAGQHAGEYLGPVTYANNALYYYSQNGIFRGELGGDLSKVDAWKLVFKPRLHWTLGQHDAIGSPINVQKMAFTSDGKLVLLALNDGIGIWDGSTFKLLP